MEKIEENVVTKGAKPAEPMQKMSGGEVEDLGGPTPENYKPCLLYTSDAADD